MKNIIAIGMSNFNFVSTMLKYLPIEKFEIDTKFVCIIDDRSDKDNALNISILIDRNANINFQDFEFIYVSEILEFYQNQLTENGKKYFLDYGASFKVLVFPFLEKTRKYKKVLLLDDDIFLLKDPSELFNNEFAFKKDGLFKYKPSSKIDLQSMQAFESIFNVSSAMNIYNQYNINSGSILNSKHTDLLETWALNYLNSQTLQGIYYWRNSAKTGRSWTLEQRFFCFYYFWLSTYQKYEVHTFYNKEVYLVTNSTSGRFSKNKKVFPIVTHYALGSKKYDFMNHTAETLDFIRSKDVSK